MKSSEAHALTPQTGLRPFASSDYAVRPLAIDLFCGLGGWTEGLLAEGYDVIGFDIERHEYGEARYPAQLVIQDVLTLDGSQFADAALIVASPPCQAYSYRAMPWKRAKALPPPSNELFEACFRIQREAAKAAGRRIPLVVENVRGAQPWVGRAAWHYGSFYLWGDVPALMPHTRQAAKVPGLSWSGSDKPGYVARGFNTTADQRLRENQDRSRKNQHVGPGSWFPISNGENNGQTYGANPARGPAIGEGLKTIGHVNKRDGHSHTRHLTNPRESDAVKQPGLSGQLWFDHGAAAHSSKSLARKAAAAHIAKIPLPLSQHIARCYYPQAMEACA